jgi:hypothetical protein
MRSRQHRASSPGPAIRASNACFDFLSTYDIQLMLLPSSTSQLIFNIQIFAFVSAAAPFALPVISDALPFASPESSDAFP